MDSTSTTPQDSSSAILANYLAQAQAANRWNSPQNLMGLATLGLNAFGGFAQGKQTERATQLSQEQLQYQQAQDAYMRRLQARAGLGSAIRGQLDDRIAAGVNFADRAPLGAEQEFAERMARLRGLSHAVEGFQPSAPSDPNILRSYNPGPNLLRAFTTDDYRNSISPEATASSIADRRRALSYINPDFQYGSSSVYGLPTTFDAGVEANRQHVAGDRLSRENQLYQLLTNQMLEASKPLYTEGQTGPQAPSTAQPEQKKKGGFWRTLGKIGLAAAPIIAAPFTGGASLAAIGALSGAGNAALDGGGWKGALMGAGMGAATAGMGGGAAGANAARGAGEAASAAVKRAILNPRALTNIAGAGIGGNAGTALQGVSMMLPGAKAFAPHVLNNTLTAASLPTSMQQAAIQAPGAGQLQLPSRPTVSDIPGLAPSVSPQRPTLPPRGAAGPSAAERLQHLRDVGAPTAPWRSHGPMAPTVPAKGNPFPPAGDPARYQGTSMRAPTTGEKFRDALSPVFDALSAMGMPGAAAASSTVPYSDAPLAVGQRPILGQALQTPLGAMMTGAVLGDVMTPATVARAAGASAPQSVSAVTGRPVLSVGPARPPAGYLPPSSLAPKGLPPGPPPAVPMGAGRIPPALPRGVYAMPQHSATTSEDMAAQILRALQASPNTSPGQMAANQEMVAWLQQYLRNLPR